MHLHLSSRLGAKATVGADYAKKHAWLADANQGLKYGIWLYFLLIIFEGALRKWVLPSLATPLLIVRDPVALWLIYKAWQQGLLPTNSYLRGMTLIGIFSVITAVLLGHGNLFVAAYGARILLLHFPLVFIIGRIFNQSDVIQVGKIMLWLTIPMTVLVTLQFYSSQSAWVNLGVGGDAEGAGFSGALGYFRPPGTFSFTNGNSLFYGLAAPFILYFWLNPHHTNRLLLLGATIALIVAIPLSISRGLFFQVGVAILFTLVATARRPKYLGHTLVAIIGGALALFLLSKVGLFQTATEAFTSRFDAAGETEGGLEGTLGDRYLGGLIEALSRAFDQPFFGYGIGMGTNVGSMLLTGGRFFLIDEGEWGRLVGELGPLMGLGVIFIRMAVSFKLALASYRKVVLGDLLPWLLLSFGLTTIPQAQWAQPTSLGFSTFIGGLIIASLRSRPPASEKNKSRAIKN